MYSAMSRKKFSVQTVYHSFNLTDGVLSKFKITAWDYCKVCQVLGIFLLICIQISCFLHLVTGSNRQLWLMCKMMNSLFFFLMFKTFLLQNYKNDYSFFSACNLFSPLSFCTDHPGSCRVNFEKYIVYQKKKRESNNVSAWWHFHSSCCLSGLDYFWLAFD